MSLKIVIYTNATFGDKEIGCLVRKLCELGWIYYKVKDYVYESVEWGSIEIIGIVGQDLCAAMQEELSNYYML